LSIIFNFFACPLFSDIGDEILELERSDAFKQLPGHERYYVPRSEYLFKFLQTELDDDLFLGNEYESMFDRFEVFLALTNATIRKRKKAHVWGPFGRFGWKTSSRTGRESPLVDVIQQAKDEGTDWAPFMAGLFGRDHDLFISAADEYMQMAAGLNWM
jgi:hypothetical protein